MMTCASTLVISCCQIVSHHTEILQNLAKCTLEQLYTLDFQCLSKICFLAISHVSVPVLLTSHNCRGGGGSNITTVSVRLVLYLCRHCCIVWYRNQFSMCTLPPANNIKFVLFSYFLKGGGGGLFFLQRSRICTPVKCDLWSIKFWCQLYYVGHIACCGVSYIMYSFWSASVYMSIKACMLHL